MKPIESLFTVRRARSHLFSDYEPGTTAYVGNGLGDNAVVGYVEPLPKDDVFQFTGIAVSAFCEASVQTPPFIACGRAGNGLAVLKPKTPMTLGQLAYVAAYINQALRWRFSWYWQTTANRIKRLPIPDVIPDALFDVAGALPSPQAINRQRADVNLSMIVLDEIYDLAPGDYHDAARIKAGSTPLVSCGNTDNGVIAFISAPADRLYQRKFTIALNGSPLTSKYHPYEFAAKDDVAICTPRAPLQFTTEVFIQAMLNRERWRYSYYRKCYIDKLKRFRLPLPTKNGGLDEDAMRGMVEAAPYGNFVETHLSQS